MLSWFGQKSPEEGHSEGTTPRPSVSSPTHIRRTSTEKAPKRAFPSAYTTPHDAIIVDLQAPTARSMPVDAPSATDEQVVSPEPEFPATREPRADPKFLSPGPQYSGVQQQQQSPRSQLLLDPFDGSVVGVLVPHQEQGSVNEDMSPSQVNLATNRDASPSTNNIETRSEAVWTHLSRILDLQGQLSKMHLEMEDIGTGKAADSKRKKHKQREEGPSESPTPGLDSEDPLVPPGLQTRKRATSTGSRGSSSNDEADGDEEGLDDLSKLLFEFHDLKSPEIEFPASRNNTISTPPQDLTSPLGSDEVESKGNSYFPMQSTSTTSNRSQEWAKQNATSSSKMHVPVGPAQSGTSTTNAPPRGNTLQKKGLPTLFIDPQVQAAVMDSPTSTIGSMKLPRKE
ncbi:hypothetical protein M413DRAFT_22347 [Hebeloma cylindrosporum]|uniref:Uncharacterized protein n=1 Tax=Hebeloma cylindrosporum TaxID=76867 RepID=A0A0C3CUE8_HEBCY|nr:hypothetical protein M413DRAFT_22347 [Hebeloma cylindrosporum h7]